ncbi:MAG: hypothetical protein LBK82_06245, partial [Planctomycetaceae bacterium]|nr:hypothetical protein [Planctomycetaceae bacterium]
LKKNSTLSYNLMSLEIDGEGKFVAGDHVMFHINENSEGNAELIQQYLDELNSIKVGDKSLGEAFLEAYANEFGIDLVAAKAEGQEIKSLQFNFAHGVAGDEFVSQSTSRNLRIGNTFYAVDEKTQEKISVNGTVGVKLGKMQSDLRAEQEVKMKELESKPKESISFKPTSLMTSMFNTLNVSSPISDVMKDLNSMLSERTITRVLDAYNVELKEGDRISMSLNGKGEFSINANNSSIWGASGKEIEGLCYNLEKALNKAQTEDGKSLGKTLLEQFAVDMGFDSAEARKDENFSISFSFRYNSEIGKNEIFGERLAKINSLLDSLFAQQENREPENKESEDELSMRSQLDTKLDTNKPEEEID